MPAMQQGFLILTPALTLTPAFDPHPSPLPAGEGDRRAVGLGVTGPFGTTGTHQFDWCHVSRIGVRDMLSCHSLVPAGAGHAKV